MSRFILTITLFIFCFSMVEAQTISIDSLSIGSVVFVAEEIVDDSTIQVNYSSNNKPEVVMYISSDSIGYSSFNDSSVLFCNFSYNGREYTVKIGHPYFFDEKKKLLVFMDSHMFDNIIYVQPQKGIFDYYNSILDIMKTFTVSYYLNNRKVCQSTQPRILTIYK